jgi:glycosyltransferase involved in cell wall biosynthesis
LRELKGFHQIAACLKGLRESGIRARLVIAGGPSRADRFASVLKEKVAACGAPDAVTFAGDVSQQALAELMCAADVYCLASTREGWPNVVNEALACGTPVVSTEVGAIRHLLPSPQYGMIVPVGDNRAMEHALGAALRHTWDRESIARWGGARSWENAAAEVRQHLIAIVENHAGQTHIHHC